jgi:PTS system mannose-specific IIA component
MVGWPENIWPRSSMSSASRRISVRVVTDMFGGSPSNLSMKACNCSSRKILYGANLPMLVKLAKSRNLPIEKAVAASLEAGRKYINVSDGIY